MAKKCQFKTRACQRDEEREIQVRIRRLLEVVPPVHKRRLVRVADDGVNEPDDKNPCDQNAED